MARQSVPLSPEVARVAARIWDEVTEGRGLVLVDGKEVVVERGA